MKKKYPSLVTFFWNGALISPFTTETGAGVVDVFCGPKRSMVPMSFKTNVDTADRLGRLGELLEGLVPS